MPTICLLYTRLLREICENLPIAMPQAVLSTNTDGLFVAYMDLPVPRQASTVDVVRCWGSQSTTSDGAKQEAARSTIKKLVEEFSLQVKDVNYDDSLFYKSLYDHLSTDYSLLFAEYNKLSSEYSFLKDCYVTTVTEKNDYVTERLKIRHAIEECHALINHLHPAGSVTDSAPSNAMPAHSG